MPPFPPIPGAPPLPAAWPYALRPALTPLTRVEGADLPGLGPGWTFVGDPARMPAGEPEGLGGAFGRGGVFRCGAAVIRPYRRGGLVRHLNGRVYPGPGRFAQELAVHRALWEAGFPTVEPLGFAFRPRLWGCEGAYLTRLAPGDPWPRTWAPEALPAVRGLLAALCAWGLHAPDLNATNFMVGPDGVLALDWDRARWTQAGDLFARYKARLDRSLRKLHAPDGFVI
ncbi:protein kinase family protein [Mesoterricola sediminis]|uniref:Lipopolysaccharide kinase (Kdo/WaaP) family protein n=1 Tax=Mesoterricola sediminis TaxID=2927980 RepID=A0AA48H5L3_9BACT|nr:hypothetical protein [Mesoterricola sediminis]BDU76393.1 hypothetical protein METESE_13510 [Mesoterricola sediminis]